MGIVSQEPVLFATTIKENIKLGAKWGDEVTQEQIDTATKQANCYDFITNLPKVCVMCIGYAMYIYTFGMIIDDFVQLRFQIGADVIEH